MTTVYVVTETRGDTWEGDSYVRGVYASQEAATQAETYLRVNRIPDDTEILVMEVLETFTPETLDIERSTAMTTPDEFATDASQPSPEAEPVPAPAPEPAYVVVSRDQVEEYASKGYRPGYVMLRP